MIVFSIVRLKVYVYCIISFLSVEYMCQTQKFYSFILGIESAIFKQKHLIPSRSWLGQTKFKVVRGRMSGCTSFHRGDTEAM